MLFPETPSQPLVTAASAMSAAGRYSMVWLAAAALSVVAFGNRAGFIWVLAAITFEWVFTNGPVKLLFRRDRPDNSDVVDMLPDWLHPPRSSSFPSGHSSAAAFTTVLFWNWSVLAGVVLAVAALAMGLSRIIIRAHHRTDVLAGFIWGSALALVAIAILGDRLP